jgi:flagellar hook-length control protein FliK
MDQVVRQVILHTNGDSSEIRVKLEPPSLGEVVVHVRMENGQMQAQIDVQQAAVKAALDAQIGQLRQSLTDRGLDVQRLDVLFGDPSTSRESSGGQDDRQQRGSSRHSSLGESPEQSQTGRMLGYNTMEIIM